MLCDDQYMHTFYNAKIKVIQHLSHIVIKLKEKGKGKQREFQGGELAAGNCSDLRAQN